MKNKTVKLAKTLSNDQSTSQTPTALFGTANKTTPSAQMPISPFSTSTQNTQEPSKESGSGLSQ
jgi:hypothetical protein